MKKKNFNKKLDLSKTTVVNLSAKSLNSVLGGVVTQPGCEPPTYSPLCQGSRRGGCDGTGVYICLSIAAC